MIQTLNTASMISILNEAATGLRSHSDELRQLDAIIGDGDIGVTVELGCKAIAEYLDSPAEDEIGKLLIKCGMHVNKASSSTFGTLLSSAFMEAGKACLGQKEIDIKDLALIGRGAIEGIKKRGKSEVGQKTMLDSLVPAVEAFQRGLADGAGHKVAVEAAIKAAKAGTEATINMKAKHGRAGYRQDGGIGVQDAGATAIYYLIESFGRSLISRI